MTVPMRLRADSRQAACQIGDNPRVEGDASIFGGRGRHLRMPLIPGIGNAMQNDDRFTRAGLDIVPRSILAPAGGGAMTKR